MTALVERVAYRWGRAVAAYGRYATGSAQIEFEGLERLPDESTIWISFHGTNMLGLALHTRATPRPTQAFVPPGIVGAGARGWVEGSGIEAFTLPREGTGNPLAALKAMARGLRSQSDVVIAVDGPHGPAGVVKPGAFWLARLTGCAMMIVGLAARPAFHYPRWDRHLIPLPGARLAAVFSEPLRVSRSQEIDAAFLEEMRRHMQRVKQRAWEIIGEE